MPTNINLSATAAYAKNTSNAGKNQIAEDNDSLNEPEKLDLGVEPKHTFKINGNFGGLLEGGNRDDKGIITGDFSEAEKPLTILFKGGDDKVHVSNATNLDALFSMGSGNDTAVFDLSTMKRSAITVNGGEGGEDTLNLGTIANLDDVIEVLAPDQGSIRTDDQIPTRYRGTGIHYAGSTVYASDFEKIQYTDALGKKIKLTWDEFLTKLGWK